MFDKTEEENTEAQKCRVCSFDISKAHPELKKRNICMSCDFFYLIQRGKVENRSKVLKCVYSEDCEITYTNLKVYCSFCRFKKCSGTTTIRNNLLILID